MADRIENYLNNGYEEVTEEEYNKFRASQIKLMREGKLDVVSDYNKLEINGEMRFFVR